MRGWGEQEKHKLERIEGTREGGERTNTPTNKGKEKRADEGTGKDFALW